MDPDLPREFARRLRGDPLADRVTRALSKVGRTSEIIVKLRDEFIDHPGLDIEIDNGVLDLTFHRIAHFRFAVDYAKGSSRWKRIL
jgi:hypothetical protein